MLSPEQRKARDQTYRKIQRHWHNGVTDSQIAKKLGISKPHLDVTVTRMRAQGWDLPHRYSTERREKAKHGRQRGR